MMFKLPEIYSDKLRGIDNALAAGRIPYILYNVRCGKALMATTQASFTIDLLKILFGDFNHM